MENTAHSAVISLWSSQKNVGALRGHYALTAPDSELFVVTVLNHCSALTLVGLSVSGITARY